MSSNPTNTTPLLQLPLTPLWPPRLPLAGPLQLELSLEDLQNRFRRHSVTATLQCTGNRRNEYNATPRKVKGLEWDGGSISNAGGCRRVAGHAGHGRLLQFERCQNCLPNCAM